MYNCWTVISRMQKNKANYKDRESLVLDRIVRDSHVMEMALEPRPNDMTRPCQHGRRMVQLAESVSPKAWMLFMQEEQEYKCPYETEVRVGNE